MTQEALGLRTIGFQLQKLVVYGQVGVALDAPLRVQHQRVAGFARTHAFYRLGNHAVQPADAVLAGAAENDAEAKVKYPGRMQQSVQFRRFSSEPERRLCAPVHLQFESRVLGRKTGRQRRFRDSGVSNLVRLAHAKPSEKL